MPAMSINAADKCPHCGTLYMSMLKPGEDPASRYCYTCDMTAGGTQMAETLQAAADANGADDELALIPNEGDESFGAPRPGRMAPGFRPPARKPAGSGIRPAASSRSKMPAVQPGSRANMQAVKGSRANMPAVQPGSRANMPAVRPGSRTNMAAVQGEVPLSPELAIQMPPRPSNSNMPAVKKGSSISLIPVTDKKGSTVNLIPVGDAAKKGSSVKLMPAARSSGRMAAVHSGKTSASMAAVTMPGGRSSARQQAIADQNKKNMILYSAIGGGVFLLAILVWAFSGGKKPATVAEADNKSTGSRFDDVARLSKAEVPTKPAEAAVKPEAAAKTEEKKVEKVEEQKAPKAELAKTAEAKKEDPAGVETKVLPALPAAESAQQEKAATGNAVADALQNAGARKAKVDDDEDDAATKKRGAPADAPKAKTESGQKGAAAAMAQDEAKKGDPLVGLGLKKKEPEKEEPPPGKAAPAPITATEPTMVPIDFGKDRNAESTFSESINRAWQGWRVRDLKLDMAKMGVTERGRSNCLTAVPLNDLLPIKMMGTIEIPQSFASRRPMLLFEASVKEVATANKSTVVRPMFVTVKAMNADILPKQPIKAAKEQPWLETGVDLSPLAGRRVELTIEISIPAKTKPELIKDYVAILRNIRIEWAGKKAAPAPDKK